MADGSETPKATSTWAGLRAGLADGLPFGLSSIVYGIGFGVIASEAKLTLLEAAIMSAVVFSGTAQFAIVQAWGAGLSLVGVFVTVLVTNARYVLLGAALRPWLGTLPKRLTWPTLALLVDGSFVRAMAARARGISDLGALLGPSLVSWLGWVGGTAAGFLVGQSINARTFGLDLVVVSFCASSLALLFKGRSDLWPIGAAIVAAICADRFLGGSWPVIAAALAATVVGAMRLTAPTASPKPEAQP
jgi:predicted branched-subunit amino acid permease